MAFPFKMKAQFMMVHRIRTALLALMAASSLAASATAQDTKPAADADKLFAPIAGVLRDPRCLNCHPVDDRPRQTDERRIHQMNVVRGPDNLGFVNMRCNACHRDENNDDTGVPGAPNWHLAPLSMGWQGLDDGALCNALLDTNRNGGKSLDEIVKHLRDDPLVLWGWAPGKGRKPVHMPHPEFMTHVEAWQSAGAPCPAAQSK